MQNWKIKRMSEKRINEWLKGINFLLGHYVKHTDAIACPFCDLANCLNCLWHIFEGKNCFDFENELGLEGDMVRVRTYKKWHIARIPMLRRWKKILQAERDSRTCAGE